MKIKEGFKIRPLGREYIITPQGASRINFNKMIALNSSAAFLWNEVQGKDFTPETLANLLVGKYTIDYKQALKDSESIAKKWVEAGLVQED